MTYDAVVIGGGFMGCSIALHLRRYFSRILVVEREAGVCRRASFNNQARVHNGYHYPRSVLTGLRSRVNFPRFVEDHPDCIRRDLTAVYAVGRHHSKVSAAQFSTFCRRIGAPLEPAPQNIARLFNPATVERAFLAEEYALDADRLAARLHSALVAAGVELAVATSATRISSDDDALTVHLSLPTGERRVAARHVFNCAYAGLNALLAASALPLIPLKHELAELALVDVPEPVKHLGITIMCGPFFSVMPFPPRGTHTLSHVRYTPHATSRDGALPARHPASNASRMIRDAQRFVPCLAECRHIGSMWEIKTVLPSSEIDDSRPILFLRGHGLPRLTCVLGGKIDNVYDATAELDVMRREGALA